MADTELRTATELLTADISGGELLPVAESANGSGLFRLKLSTLKAYILASVYPAIAGQAGKFLRVNANATAVEWATPAGGGGGGGGSLPAGGSTGQVLGKLSDVDGDADWIDQSGGGGGGTDASYRYWRIFNAFGLDPTGNFIHGEIRWTDVQGNTLTYVIAGNSDQFPGYPIAAIGDGNPQTYGILAGQGPHYINFDFGKPKNPETIQFLTNSDAWKTQSVDTFRISHSDDGVTWTDLAPTFTNPSHTVGVWGVVNVPTAKTRARLDDLLDVDVTQATTGKVLMFNADTQLWGPGSVSGGGGGGGGLRSYSTHAIAGNGTSQWGGEISNAGAPIPGYELSFTLEEAGTFRVTYNIGYTANHQVRFRPRRNGNRFQQITPGDVNTTWDFCTFSIYEGSTVYGFERSFLVDLPAGTHTFDALYNAMNATNTFVTGEGFIVAQEV